MVKDLRLEIKKIPRGKRKYTFFDINVRNIFLDISLQASKQKQI